MSEPHYLLLVAERDALLAQLLKIQAECIAMRAVVEAAEELVDILPQENYRPDNFTWQPLERAVDAYRKATQ